VHSGKKDTKRTNMVNTGIYGEKYRITMKEKQKSEKGNIITDNTIIY
jgi:hypothetical protein